MKITSKEQLRELYGWPKGRAVSKLQTQLDSVSKHFIANVPFFVLSTYDSNGTADASPRGGEPGFIRVLDDHTLLIPDARGNNRVDSLFNIVETGQVGCLLLIPGIDETLRINGTAEISVDPAHIALFTEERHPPKSCIKIEVKEAFLHCAKAFMRSDLWGETNRVERPGFPTMGTMLNDQIGQNGPVETQEEMVKRYWKSL